MYYHADLMEQFSIDARHSSEPWAYWEKWNFSLRAWEDCTQCPSFHAFEEYRRKEDAPVFSSQLIKAEEKTCEWQEGMYYKTSCNTEFNDDVRFIVTGSNVLPKFCPNCGSKITTKPKMCELAGVEFPVPVKWEDRANGNWLVDTSRNEIAVIHCCGNFYNHYINNRVQKTREAAHQQLKAEVAALKQVIEEAK